MADGVVRSDLRLGVHPCSYRKARHQIQGGCGCLCDLCEINDDANVSSAGEAPPRSEN